MSCRLIITAFSESGLCAGPSPARDEQLLVARMAEILQARGLTVERMEPLARSGCFALLIYAHAGECHSLNLLGLRHELAQDAHALGLQLRVQREDLFLAMHRL